MRRGTIVLLVVIVIAALVIMATVKPLSSMADDTTERSVSIKTLSCASTIVTIALNGTASGTLDLNGAVIRVGMTNATGTEWLAPWTISSSAWQGSVQKVGTTNLSSIIIDHDEDRRMGPNDRIEVRRTVNGTAPSLVISFEAKFPGGQQANCSFTFAQTDGTATMVSFIDVGQGDSVLIAAADGRIIIIDTGPPLASGVLVSYLNNRSVSVIDALIVTHPDADHLGGAADVLRDFTVLSVYHPGVAKNTSSYRSFIQAAQNEGCPVHTAADTHAGDFLNITVSATIEVLNIDPTATDVNDASIVLELRTPVKSFLFTGDIDSEVEGKLIADHSFDLDVDVLKVGHHGSRYSTSDAFLDATRPEIAVICVGENTYGHPTNETLSRLLDHGTTIFRTDQTGTIDISA